MIIKQKNQVGMTHTMPSQRLGNKALFSTLVPNDDGVYVKYFSGVDAEIYFEDVYVDEVVEIEYSIKQNALPLYGYNSYVYDDIAVGSRIVSGKFKINFTKANYMYNVLDVMNKIKHGVHSTTEKVSSRAPLWRNGFDIYVSYGDAKNPMGRENYGGSVVVLKHVTLGTCTQEFSAKGEPILEEYEFIARDIDWLPEGSQDQNPYVGGTQQQGTYMPEFTVTFEEDKARFDFKDNVQVIKLEYNLDGCNVTEDIIKETSGKYHEGKTFSREYSRLTKNKLKELLNSKEQVKIDVELKVLQGDQAKIYRVERSPELE